jgi:hypothetical protein
MKTIAKAALGALALASFGMATAAPASAQSFGFSFGTGPYYGGYYSNPCYEPYGYRPYYCYRPAPVYRSYRPYYRPYAYNYRDRYWDRGRHRGWYR